MRGSEQEPGDDSRWCGKLLALLPAIVWDRPQRSPIMVFEWQQLLLYLSLMFPSNVLRTRLGRRNLPCGCQLVRPHPRLLSQVRETKEDNGEDLIKGRVGQNSDCYQITAKGQVAEATGMEATDVIFTICTDNSSSCQSREYQNSERPQRVEAYKSDYFRAHPLRVPSNNGNSQGII
jgi:hypothetical protein